MFINCDLHVASSDNRAVDIPGSTSVHVHVVLYVHMCLCLFPSLSLPCGWAGTDSQLYYIEIVV